MKERQSLARFLGKVLEEPDAGSILKGLFRRGQGDFYLRSAKSAKALFTLMQERL